MTFCEFLEKKSHIFMTIFICVQSILFILFTVLFFIEESDKNLRYNLYVTCILTLFLVYMIHFAYHSIKKAYFIELISFLVMSTISSVLLVYNYFHYIIYSDEAEEQNKVNFNNLFILFLNFRLFIV